MPLLLSQALSATHQRLGYYAPWRSRCLLLSTLDVIKTGHTSPLGRVGCDVCAQTIDEYLDATSGTLVFRLQKKFMWLHQLAFHLRFHAVTAFASLRLVQCLDLPNGRIVVHDATYGAVAADTSHLWVIEWGTLLSDAAVGIDQSPGAAISGHLFYFDGVTLVLHQRCEITLADDPSDCNVLAAAVDDGFAISLLERLHQQRFMKAALSPAVHRAVAKRYWSLLDILLSHGANIEAVDKSFHTPLSKAVADADEACVAELVKRGASPFNLASGISPLFTAIQLGHVGITRLLVAADTPKALLKCVPVERRDLFNRAVVSALGYAYICNQPEVALLLLHAGASPSTDSDTTVLASCIAHVENAIDRMTHVLELLDRGAAPDIHVSSSPEHATAMVCAIQRRDYDLVRLLIARQEYIPPMAKAAMEEAAAAVSDSGRMQHLIGSASASVNWLELPALFAAIQDGDVARVKELVAPDVLHTRQRIFALGRLPPSVRPLPGGPRGIAVSPLMFAYICNQPEIAHELLEAGAPVCMEDGESSALYYCIACIEDETTRVGHVLELLERGASSDISKGDVSPLTYAEDADMFRLWRFSTRTSRRPKPHGLTILAMRRTRQTSPLSRA
ncbi:hypothetical protein SPRG_14946 [Saprolegnia parasitica CBS 223.65]|uniref:Uncharacterized protein n=1 Tax=Saprolegnia parasitica (strain CBS 223.65) TaxID=695850 RepID=A0A067BZW4_SAPPC|nr:hypothetical protein SPRG_14946 [Saprolegnia parasitica CBS 223.65]KDO19846.1 hypothetical protein SPRG_14946 [Saprolegnia parasitica CBS 223.65]|eukprot:XP_012209458.1 hypothetical protein SPRG_14946 [Saprolegnia parasitica CBS 223.65]